MAVYCQITSTRTTVPNVVALLAAVRTALANDATVGIVPLLEPTLYRVKRSSDDAFTEAEIAAVQTAIDSAPAYTPQTDAQNQIDQLPLVWKAIALALLDQINVLRVRAGLAEISVQQAIAGIRAKAAQL